MNSNSPLTHFARTAACLAITLVSALAQETPRPAFPSGIRLPATTRGEAAITALGKKLPEVAAHYRKTPDQLRHLFRSDACLHADPEGRLFYACDLLKHAEAPAPEESPSASIGPTDPSPFPTAEAFLLHSRPGANRVIYLDFDGHIDNTPGNWKDGAAAPPFDTNSDPAVFSTAERERIIYIWQRVAEDFSMFDINVTTEDPGIEALRKSNTSDQVYGIRCVIGGRSGGTGDWYTNSAGGVAFVGTFDAGNDVPCWVFPLNLGNSEKNIAEAASHEVGHTLGLNHDGTSSANYYSGHGSWAPIMGVGYSKEIVQWSKGEYTGANNTQDDLAIMLTQGAVYRPDDHGSTTATATFLTADALPVLGEGVIEKRADLDFFRVIAAGGSLSINAKVPPRDSNLRIELKLYDSAQNLLQTATATDTTAGTQAITLTRSVTAGTYYFSVDGVANGDPLSTGYSDYASLGQYLLSITGVLPGGTTWQPTAAGSYQWNTLTNWSASPVINAAGATLRVNNNIAGNQTINLTTPVTIGNLYLGDSNNTHSFNLSSTGGTLTFDNLAAPANLSKTTGSHDTISATLVFTSNLIVTQSSSGNLSLTGPVTGSGSLTKTGPGNLVLSGAKNYTGTTTVEEGVLRIDTADALPTGNLTLTGGGILGITSTFSRIQGTDPSEVQWAGNGGFAAFGADRSVSIGTVSWGSTTLSGKALILGHPTADATVLWGSNISFAGGSRTIQVNDGTDPIDAKIGGVLSGGGTFNKTGGGTLEISSGSNSFTAITNLTDGLLLLSHNSALPTASNLLLAGGTLGLGSGNFIDRTLGTGTSQVRWNAESGFAAFGATRAVKFSASSINWIETHFIGDGRNLVLSHPTATATLDWQQAISFAGANRTIEVLDGSAAIDAQISAVIAGGSSGNINQLIKTGEGTLALTAQNTYFGDTNINAGTVMIGNGGTAGGISQNTPAIIVASGASLAVNRSDTVTQGTNPLKVLISGEGELTQQGSGTTLLNLANTYTGDTHIDAGNLEISGTGTLGAGNYPGDITLATGTSLRFTTSSSQTLTGTISGPGAITLNNSAATLTLAGPHNYSGNTTVTNGTLSLSSPNPNNQSSTLTLGSTAILHLNYTGTDTVDKFFIGTIQQPAGTYGHSSTGATNGGLGVGALNARFTAATGTLTVTIGPPPAGYTTWQTANSTTQAANLDHDNDGVPNGIEHFLGGTTNTTGFTALPGIATTSGIRSVTWTKHPTYTGTYGTDFVIETSPTLTGIWTTEILGINVTITGNNVKYTFPTATKNFARLKVTRP